MKILIESILTYYIAQYPVTIYVQMVHIIPFDHHIHLDPILIYNLAIPIFIIKINYLMNKIKSINDES